MKNKDLLGPLIDDLFRNGFDPGEIYECPYCNGELHVSIRIYISEPIQIVGKPIKSVWDKYLGTGAHCKNCNSAIFAQYGADAILSWAKESEYKHMSIDDLWKLLRKDSKDKT